LKEDVAASEAKYAELQKEFQELKDKIEQLKSQTE